MPRVTIGMPVYNGDKYLAKAIDSVLNQTFADFELIISDNGSTDSSPDICQYYAKQDNRIRLYLYDVNRGAAWNHNNVIRLAEGEFFKWLACDDMLAPKFLERCLEAFQHFPESSVCFSKSIIIDENGDEVRQHSDGLHLAVPDKVERFRKCLFRKRGKINAVLGLIRRSALGKTSCLGNYNASDEVLMMNLALLGEFQELPEFLMYRRDHPDNSIRANPTAKDITLWFDPSRRPRIVLPKLRLAFEEMRCVVACELLWAERLICMKLIIKECWFSRKIVLRDIKKAVSG